MPVLVAYTGTQSANRLISARIRSELEARGCPAVSLGLRRVADLDAYEAVLLGSSMVCGLWSREAHAFARRHQARLAAIPVWMFSVAPAGEAPGFYSTAVTSLKRTLGARGHHVFRSPQDFRFLAYHERMSLNAEIARWSASVAKELAGDVPARSRQLAA